MSVSSCPVAAPSDGGCTGLAGLGVAGMFFPCSDLGLAMSRVSRASPELLSEGFGAQAGDISASPPCPRSAGATRSVENPPGRLQKEMAGPAVSEAEPAGLVPGRWRRSRSLPRSRALGGMLRCCPSYVGWGGIARVPGWARVPLDEALGGSKAARGDGVEGVLGRTVCSAALMCRARAWRCCRGWRSQALLWERKRRSVLAGGAWLGSMLLVARCLVELRGFALPLSPVLGQRPLPPPSLSGCRDGPGAVPGAWVRPARLSLLRCQVGAEADMPLLAETRPACWQSSVWPCPLSPHTLPHAGGCPPSPATQGPASSGLGWTGGRALDQGFLPRWNLPGAAVTKTRAASPAMGPLPQLSHSGWWWRSMGPAPAPSALPARGLWGITALAPYVTLPAEPCARPLAAPTA